MHTTLRAIVVASALLLGACGPGNEFDPPLLTAEGRTVTVTAVDTLLAEDGSVAGQAPFDLGSPTVHLDDGTVIPLTGGAGTWSAKVPPGPYWLATATGRFRVRWYRTSVDTIDLGHLATTRASRVVPRRSTPLSLDVSGLVPWQSSDRLQLFAWGADDWDIFDPALASQVTAARATDDVAAPGFGDGTMALLDGTDTLHVTQLRLASVSGGEEAQVVAAAGTVTGVAMTEGTAAVRAVALATPTQSGDLSVGWSRPAFETVLGPVEPGGLHDLTVFAQRLQASDEMSLGSSPNLFAMTSPTGSGGLRLTNVGYGRWLPSSYRDLLVADVRGSVRRSTPGGASAPVQVLAWRRVEVAKAPATLDPLVGPVRQVRIAGRDATTPQAGVGSTPTVTWAPPSLGTPDRVVLTLSRFTGSVWSYRAQLFVPAPATSVQLPAGLLDPGASYVLTLVAEVGAGPEDAPERQRVAAGKAYAVTEGFTP